MPLCLLRVVVAEDSTTARRLIVMLLRADPEIEVVGEAADGAQAVELCKQLRPDVVTMDIQMPVMDGVEATKQIMIELATPVVMVSSLDPSDIRRSMHALNAGALAVLAKPAGPGTPGFERDSRDLIATVKAMAQVKLVRRWAAVPPYRTAAVERAVVPMTGSMVGIVASTGGPNAVRRVLSALPPDLAAPILIVQHIAAGFGSGFAQWLHDVTGHPVHLAVDHETLEAGVAYIAPDDRHLGVTRDRRVELSSAPPIGGFRPSGSHLFSSLALACGSGAVGVILTGMGRDGVEGLRKLADAGGSVVVQDEATSDIYGMPAAAFQAGLVAHATPLDAIGPRIIELLAARRAP